MKKTNRWLLFLLAGVVLFLGSCQNTECSCPLNRMNWSEKNFTVLNDLIRDYGVGGKYYNKEKPPYAVLDWDMTCAIFDVEDALMRYQLFHLRYKMTKNQFAGLLKDTINGTTHLGNDFQNMLLANINQDLKNDYDFLYDNFSGLNNGTMALDEIQKTPQFMDFAAKILFLYDAYYSSPEIGHNYAYSWVLYLFTGHTTDEVKAMATEAISYELGNQLSIQHLQSPASLKTKAGVVNFSYHSGLRVISEMQNLITTFRQHGIDVFIVSASYKPVVEAFAGIGAFGYNVPPENVIAMELEVAGDGKILPQYKTGWVQTFGSGKVEAINQAIKEKLGRNWDPLFSAGDSDGDYEMSIGFPDMKLSLVWNRCKHGKIGKLCKQAVNETNNEVPRYILQGRDENAGIVIPCSESILLGTAQRQLGTFE